MSERIGWRERLRELWRIYYQDRREVEVVETIIGDHWDYARPDGEWQKVCDSPPTYQRVIRKGKIEHGHKHS